MPPLMQPKLLHQGARKSVPNTGDTQALAAGVIAAAGTTLVALSLPAEDAVENHKSYQVTNTPLEIRFSRRRSLAILARG